jgi:ABC-2 type transport system permease protein
VKKVRLPVQLLPAASVLSALVNFLLSLVVLFAVLAIFGPRHPEGLIYLPLLMLVELGLALGFAYLLAGLNVFYRDVEHILGILLMAWYFLTPILFPISLVAGRPRELLGLSLNPMTGIVVDWSLLAWSVAVALAVFVIGFTYFRRAKDDFESAL